MSFLKLRFRFFKPALEGFVVRTCLTADFFGAIPIFVLLIWHRPESYAEILAQSGETIRREIAEYRK